MRYIKNKKIYDTPIKLIDGNTTIITNDDDIIKSYGYEEYIPNVPIEEVEVVSVEQLIKEAEDKINKDTDMKILTGFFWENTQFYLSMENQFNFKNMYDLADYHKYPLMIKTMNDFIYLKDESEVREFYISGVKWIEKCLHEGWEKKAEAAEKIKKDYLNN